MAFDPVFKILGKRVVKDTYGKNRDEPVKTAKDTLMQAFIDKDSDEYPVSNRENTFMTKYREALIEANKKSGDEYVFRRVDDLRKKAPPEYIARDKRIDKYIK